MCNGGYFYTIDRCGANGRTQWKCERSSTTLSHAKCSGRAVTCDNKGPVTVITDHNHIPEPEREEGLLALNDMLARAHISGDNPRTIMKNCQLKVSKESAPYMCRPGNIRQRIQRIRVKQIDHGENPENREGIIINDELRYTFDGDLFLWYEDEEDTCDCDTDKLFIFATESNFIILNNNPHWYGDGTFDVAPLIFKQVYTLNVIESGKNLPLIYALLPDKKGLTYDKMFRIIKEDITNDPQTITLDFEKACINSVLKYFPLCLICLCYFHLTQNLWKNVQLKGLATYYAQDPLIRRSFKLVKCLVFVPPKYVPAAFIIISKSAPIMFKPILDYFEEWYIGVIVRNTIRRKPCYPIPMWNLHSRILKG